MGNLQTHSLKRICPACGCEMTALQVDLTLSISLRPNSNSDCEFFWDWDDILEHREPFHSGTYILQKDGTAYYRYSDTDTRVGVSQITFTNSNGRIQVRTYHEIPQNQWFVQRYVNGLPDGYIDNGVNRNIPTLSAGTLRTVTCYRTQSLTMTCTGYSANNSSDPCWNGNEAVGEFLGNYANGLYTVSGSHYVTATAWLQNECHSSWTESSDKPGYMKRSGQLADYYGLIIAEGTIRPI